MTYEIQTPLSSDEIYLNMTSLAHEICVQILKMEMVMDCVVDTQLKLATQSRNFRFIYLVKAT